MSLERVRLGVKEQWLHHTAGPLRVNSAEERAETSQFTPGLSVIRMPSCSLQALATHSQAHTEHVGRDALSSAHPTVATLASTASRGTETDMVRTFRLLKLM